MAEVRYCDNCGRRLPIVFLPGEKRVCPFCSLPVPDALPSRPSMSEAPAGPPSTPAPTRAPSRRVPSATGMRATHGRPRGRSGNSRRSSRTSAAGPARLRSGPGQSSNVALIVGIAAAVVLGVVLLIVFVAGGTGTRRGPSRVRVPPPPGRGTGRVPTPVPPASAAEGKPAAVLDDRPALRAEAFHRPPDEDEGFYKNLRKESESRWRGGGRP